MRIPPDVETVIWVMLTVILVAILFKVIDMAASRITMTKVIQDKEIKTITWEEFQAIKYDDIKELYHISDGFNKILCIETKDGKNYKVEDKKNEQTDIDKSRK